MQIGQLLLVFGRLNIKQLPLHSPHVFGHLYSTLRRPQLRSGLRFWQNSVVAPHSVFEKKTIIIVMLQTHKNKNHLSKNLSHII